MSCRSCGEGLRGPWCHLCGQGHHHVRLSLRALTGEVFGELLDADTRLVRTVRALLRDPARACRESIGGRRVPWMHPFK